MPDLLLHFADEAVPAQRLAAELGVPAAEIERHRFPDGEWRLRLPVDEAGGLPAHLIVYRSLDRPNEKLIELLLLARQARLLGAAHLTLVAPYLAYMRQDIAFHPGEVVSQRVIGQFLADLFSAVITVDPHLHRVATLAEAVPVARALALSGAPMLAQLVAAHHASPVLIGPDAESAQWIDSAAAGRGWRHGVCTKTRHGDRDVRITLPEVDVRGQAVVLIDDVASSGRTLAEAARLLLAAGAQSVDAAVTHALFADDALSFMQQAGIRHVWSTDCIAHPSNAAPMAPLLAEAVRTVQQALRHNTAPR
ncbi:phosphoribosylpyrophosphate synthetase [Aquabacterium olei]|uniref:Phosphoribosylpyrophosphate synthetase n=1 Tax=Aquabacterium olei TaxID=1296669 RepID=A0A2U8FR90_9BURK|nr:ribose-phosphate diphosphokinase [Aquabacterium olei]AWI53553.1 phosphoribosylpyrophosphate synthetase [Aquabacterium olei]